MRVAWCICTEFSCFINWLDRWQTLISGVLAVVAAVYAGVKLNQQIRLQRQQINDERERFQSERRRSDLSGRALLPDALDALHVHCDDLYRWLDGRDSMPAFPERAAEVLKASLPFLSLPGAGAVVELCNMLQIHRARFDNRPGAMLPVDKLYDCLVLRATVDRLFAYARLKTDDVVIGPPSVDELRAALTSMEVLGGGCSGALQSDIHDKLDLRAQREAADSVELR